eukprot:354219-Chlamydomonas_euryale.AAC.3
MFAASAPSCCTARLSSRYESGTGVGRYAVMMACIAATHNNAAAQQASDHAVRRCGREERERELLTGGKKDCLPQGPHHTPLPQQGAVGACRMTHTWLVRHLQTRAIIWAA